MTSATPVERVVALLSEAHFRHLSEPIVVAGIRFEFDAVLVGTGLMPDLVIVVDTTTEKDERLRTKIEGIARALDVVRSRRPLTTILVGPRPRTVTLETISKVCRVLPVGTLTAENEDVTLRNWLAILMPLTLPQPSDAIADPMNELLTHIDADDPVLSGLLEAAPRGAEEVREQFHRLVQEPLDGVELDDT
jgi:hypothetical protein